MLHRYHHFNFRQQVQYGTLPRGGTSLLGPGPIAEEAENDGGGVAVIEQSEPAQGGQLRRSQDGRISLR